MRERIVSISVLAGVMGTMLIAGQTDVLEDPPQQYQLTIEYCQEAAGAQEEIPDPEVVMMERTHNVHLYTQEDADLIKRVSMAEAEGEGPDGLWMVQSTIINRMRDESYPATAAEVIRQKNAFSCLYDGRFERAAATSDDCEEAWARIESGDVCPEIIAFESVDSNALDEWFKEAFTYRHHKFYTKK